MLPRYLPRYVIGKYRARARIKNLDLSIHDPDGRASLAGIARALADFYPPALRASVFHDPKWRRQIAASLPGAGALPVQSAIAAGAVRVGAWHSPKRLLRPPQHLTNRPGCFFEGDLYAAAQSLSVYRLQDGYLARVGDAPIIFAPDGRHVIGECSSRFAPMLAASRADVPGILARAPTISGLVVALIGDYQSENYCHWLLDELPRLGLVPDLAAGVFRVALRPLTRPFQFELLRRWGIGADQLLFLDDFAAIRAEQLIIFDHIAHNTAPAHHGADWVLAPLRRALSPQTTDGPAKIYLARDDARGRRIVNADIFDVALAAHGYQKIVLSALSCQQQINLFAGVRRIVAPHGAGLANLVFCRQLERVIEIFPPDYGTPFAHVLTDLQGARYATFATRDKVPGVRPQQDDIHIDMDVWQAVTAKLL